MTFDITKVKITSKLMILQGGCTNFRSIGDEMIINYAESSSLLVCADMNGAGKSTLIDSLPMYALTGKTSVKEDKVGALINTTIGKKMSCFLIWYFAGSYYKVVRGQKPDIYDLYSLVEGKWVEIPDLPVSKRDRQIFQYSILGLDQKTAYNVIENTILLSGQRFKGFSSLSGPDRRTLVESVLDLGIFSSLNAETKSLRAEVIVAQKQTFLEVTDAKLQVALGEQEVEHKKALLHGLVDTYSAQREALTSKIDNYTTLHKDAIQLDTGGGYLHEEFESISEELASEVNDLDIKLEEDLSSLGEFTLDESDSVLNKLRADLYIIDQSIEISREALEEKRDNLSSETLEAKTRLEEKLNTLEKAYKADIENAKTLHSELLLSKQELSATQYKVLQEEQDNYDQSMKYHEDCLANVEAATLHLEGLVVKEKQYQDKCKKLSDAIVYLEAKKAQEDSNLEGLVKEGECPCCKSVLSEAYVASLKEDLNVKISEIQSDLDLYNERLLKGNKAILALGVDVTREGHHVSTLQLKDATPCDKLLVKANSEYSETNKQLSLLKKEEVGSDIINTYNYDRLSLQNEINSYEAKIKDTLGELETEYKLLVNSKPIQVENISQQRLDRIEAMKSDFGAKERSLHSVYNLAVANVQDKLKSAERRLEEGLDLLQKDKDRQVSAAVGNLVVAEQELDILGEKHYSELEHSQDIMVTVAAKHFCKVSDLRELNKVHDKQQQDIEDYNDLLLLLSDKGGSKSDIIKLYLPKLNKDVNVYLESMGLFLDIEIDSEFNITMLAEDRKGTSVFSLSAGQKSKLDLALLLSLRDLAASKESVSCNMLILDEVLDPLSCDALSDIILMLQERYSDNNIVVITQRGDEVKDLFTSIKEYTLRGGFTVELQNED